MTIECTAVDAESPATLRPSGMYFVPLTGRPFDVTDETLAVWATEDLRASRRPAESRPLRFGVGS
jgi:hypothetical protein